VDGGGGCSPGDGGSVVRRTVPATRAAVYQRGLGPRAALHALRSAPLDDPGDRRVTLSECPTDQGRARACTARITDASCNAPGLESPGALASRAGLTASTTTPRAVARAPRCRHTRIFPVRSLPLNGDLLLRDQSALNFTSACVATKLFRCRRARRPGSRAPRRRSGRRSMHSRNGR